MLYSRKVRIYNFFSCIWVVIIWACQPPQGWYVDVLDYTNQYFGQQPPSLGGGGIYMNIWGNSEKRREIRGNGLFLLFWWVKTGKNRYVWEGRRRIQHFWPKYLSVRMTAWEFFHLCIVRKFERLEKFILKNLHTIYFELSISFISWLLLVDVHTEFVLIYYLTWF